MFENIPLLQIAIRVGIAFIVFLFGRWLIGRARTILEDKLAKTKIAPSMARLLILAAYYGCMLLVVILSLAIAGVPLQPMLTASLIIVVVLGIAFQQSLGSLAATILFMLFEPFRLGEQVEANGMLGTVKEIQLFSTVLVTGDNKEVTIPNSQIQGNNLINFTRLGSLRANFEFGIGYSDDLRKAKEVLREILAADPHVLVEPAPVIFVKSLDESCVNIAAFVAVKPEDYWTLFMTLPEQVKLRFDAEGISIPFPQHDVHLYGGDTAGLFKS
jgi:small conductance mechanosensitive channel